LGELPVTHQAKVSFASGRCFAVAVKRNRSTRWTSDFCIQLFSIMLYRLIQCRHCNSDLSECQACPGLFAKSLLYIWNDIFALLEEY
jgi:hypothetical protein